MPKSSPPSNVPAQQSNWPFLLIAVLMALVLWLFVRTGADPLGQRIIYLPVKVVNAAPQLTVSPSRIEVRLEATNSLMGTMSPEDVAVVADLAGHREGDLVTLTVVPPQGFKVLSTSVNQVRVVTKPAATPSR